MCEGGEGNGGKWWGGKERDEGRRDNDDDDNAAIAAFLLPPPDKEMTLQKITIKSIRRTGRVMKGWAREVTGEGGESMGGGARQSPRMMITATMMP